MQCFIFTWGQVDQNFSKHWNLSLKNLLFFKHVNGTVHTVWPGWVKLHEPQTFPLSQGSRKGLGESSQVGKLKSLFWKVHLFFIHQHTLTPFDACRRNRNTENTWSQTEHMLILGAAENNCDCNTLKTLATTEDGKRRKASETQSSTRRQIHRVDKHRIKGDHEARVHQTTCVSAKDNTGRQWRWFQLFKNQNKIGWSLNKILCCWIKIAQQRYSRKPL